MKNLFLATFYFLFFGCTSTKKASLDDFFFNDKKTKINSVNYFKVKLHYKEVFLKNVSEISEQKVTLDSAVIIGNNQKYFCQTKSAVYYNDDEYFFNFFDNDKAIYGKATKINNFGFLNVIKLLSYINNNFVSYRVLGNNQETIEVVMKDNNDLHCDNVYITINRQKNFMVSQINYFTRLKDNNLKMDLYIDEFILGDAKEAISPFFEKFYSKVGDNVILSDSLKKYKLTKVW